MPDILDDADMGDPKRKPTEIQQQIIDELNQKVLPFIPLFLRGDQVFEVQPNNVISLCLQDDLAARFLVNPSSEQDHLGRYYQVEANKDAGIIHHFNSKEIYVETEPSKLDTMIATLTRNAQNPIFTNRIGDVLLQNLAQAIAAHDDKATKQAADSLAEHNPHYFGAALRALMAAEVNRAAA